MTTRGERLRDYLTVKTGGRHGWQAALVAKSGVKRQTITKWTRADFDGYPDLETLATVADALGTPLSEVVAAIEGETVPRPVDDAMRQAMREELRALLPELLSDPSLRLPGRTPRGRGDAAS